MLYESASRAGAVLALNIEELDLPNKQARIAAKCGDIMWITWGTDTAHLLPRLIAGRDHGPLFLSEHRPGPHRRHRVVRRVSIGCGSAQSCAPTIGSHGTALGRKLCRSGIKPL
ncbi:hypothetical protein [Nocardia amamiensis]|nr:hypothetical protein [Nocardia amamiensis]